MSTCVTIVDDSKISRKMVLRALPPGWDIEVTHATNGSEAIDAARAGKADIMFLDLTMPEIDGYQVLNTLLEERLDCSVIVISAELQASAQAHATQLGALAFIQKPVKQERLERILRDCGLWNND